MSNYIAQAARYQNDTDELDTLLDKVEERTKEVEEMLETAYTGVQYDYFTNRIYDGNENVKQDVKDIKEKIENVSSSLIDKARELDLEEERLLAEAKQQASAVTSEVEENGISTKLEM